MYKYAYWPEGLKLIIALFVVILVCCAPIAIFGSRFIQKLGQYPTKNEQFSLWLLFWMILGLGLMLCCFYIVSD